MAVNTRNRRASVIGLAVAARLVLPAPDGALVQADRQQTAYSYAGILAQPLVIFVATPDWVVQVPADDTVVRAPADDLVVRIPEDPLVRL